MLRTVISMPKLPMIVMLRLIGARKQNTPKNSANLWTRYNFNSDSGLKDLGIGFGMQYQSSKVPWFTRAFTLPDFTVFDAAFITNPTKAICKLRLMRVIYSIKRIG